jgi:tetratricopeptide (TPR) repeat protein
LFFLSRSGFVVWWISLFSLCLSATLATLAIRAYDEAIRINPEYAGAYYNKGNALSDLGRKDEAIRAYDEAIRINPEYAEVWFNKGLVFNNQQNTTKLQSRMIKR